MKLHNKRNNGTVTVDDALGERLDKALWEPVRDNPAPARKTAKKAAKKSASSSNNG